jgi:hypothetical protein
MRGLIRVVAQDLIDQHMRDNQGKPVMQLVMGGKFAQQIICRGLPYKSEKEEEFYQVTHVLSEKL